MLVVAGFVFGVAIAAVAAVRLSEPAATVVVPVFVDEGAVVAAVAVADCG